MPTLPFSQQRSPFLGPTDLSVACDVLILVFPPLTAEPLGPCLQYLSIGASPMLPPQHAALGVVTSNSCDIVAPERAGAERGRLHLQRNSRGPLPPSHHCWQAHRCGVSCRHMHAVVRHSHHHARLRVALSGAAAISRRNSRSHCLPLVIIFHHIFASPQVPSMWLCHLR